MSQYLSFTSREGYYQIHCDVDFKYHRPSFSDNILTFFRTIKKYVKNYISPCFSSNQQKLRSLEKRWYISMCYEYFWFTTYIRSAFAISSLHPQFQIYSFQNEYNWQEIGTYGQHYTSVRKRERERKTFHHISKINIYVNVQQRKTEITNVSSFQSDGLFIHFQRCRSLENIVR